MKKPLLAIVGMFVSLGAGAQAEDIANGRDVYELWCAPCHAAGPKHPGTQALEVLYRGSKPAALLDRRDLTPALVRVFVRNGVSIMPFFRKTEISDKDLDDLAAFLTRRESAPN